MIIPNQPMGKHKMFETTNQIINYNNIMNIQKREAHIRIKVLRAWDCI